jgi:uncharacterized protein
MTEDPLSGIRFILDVHLGKLAKRLRLFGFDAFLNPDFNDNEIITFSLTEKRIILTRDKELLASSKIADGYRVLSQYPEEQLREVFIRYDLKSRIRPFIRCMECNSLLEGAGKEDIADLLYPKAREYYLNFKKCPGCGRIYWEGSHYKRMSKYIDSVIKDVN